MKIGPFLIAVFLAAIAAVFVLRGDGDAPAPQQQQVQQVAAKPVKIDTVNIYVAAQPIQIGSVITPDMLIQQPWPKHLMVEGFVLADGKTPIEGLVARSAFQPQEPLIASKLAKPDDPSYLSANLPKGMRVVTLRTNEIDGLAGLVFPGDRVDLILSREVTNAIYENPDQQKLAEQIRVTENILNNVLVLAVDQRAEGTPPPAQAQGQSQARRDPPRSLSVMVSPIDVRRLRLAEIIAQGSAGRATLSMSLRSLEDKDSSEPLAITYVNDVSQYRPQIITAAAQVAKTKSALVTVVRGTEIEDKKDKKRQLDIEDVVSSSAIIPAPRGTSQTAGAARAATQ